MKARVIVVAIVMMGCSAAIGQSEYDDVYFSRKDRQKAQALEPKTLKTLDQNTTVYASLPKGDKTNQLSHTDSYSGRNINPDYQNAQSTGTDVSSYFVSNYQPMGVNNRLNQNSMYSSNGYNSYGSGWGMRTRFGFGNGMYSPFYSPYSSFGYSPFGYNNYSPYGYGMYDPFNSYNSWGSSYSSWGSSYYGYGSYGYGSGWGMGCNYGFGSGMFGGWYSSYYSRPIVIVNNQDTHVNRTYGKRSSRNDGLVNNGAASRGTQVSGSGVTNPNRSGRVATTTGTSTANRYYQRGWRQDPAVNPTSGSRTSGSRSSGWVGGSSNTSRSTWGNTNSGWNTNNFGGGSRSNSSFNSGGSRSFGGSSFGGGSGGGGSRSSGGSHSGGGSRGRN